MRMAAVGGMATALLILLAGAAQANQPPGPQLLLAEVSLLPLMMLLSVAGGAYAVLHRLRPARRKSRAFLKAAGAILAILLSGAGAGIALGVAVIFGVLALQRAGQMLRWGLQARSAKESPPHVLGANPGRLIAAGAALLLLTSLLLGLVLAFVGYAPVGEGRRQGALRQFVAYRLALARAEQATGQTCLRPAGTGGAGAQACPVPLPTGARLTDAADGKGFTVRMTPRTAFPFFPYNYLTSQPSYRADGTGEIRMIEVHDRDTECPPEAPIVARVREEEIQAMLRRLEQCSPCP